MNNIDYIILFVSIIVSIVILYNSITTIIETRNKYYQDFITQRKNRKINNGKN